MHTAIDTGRTRTSRVVMDDEAEGPATAPETHFSTDHLKAALGPRAVRGGAATLVSHAGRFLLQLAASVVLARLLAPEDYGLFAIVLAVATLFSVFKEVGFSSATVQSANVNHEQASALFWIGLAAACAVALVTAALAPLAAWVYGEPRLVWMTCALAAGFLLAGLGAQHRALLRRQMRLGALAVIDVTSFAAGAGVGVAGALAGARHWSLVLMHLVWAAGGTVGAWVACGWRPGLVLRAQGVRTLLSFGGHLTGLEVVNYLSRNVDSLLLGWWWGTRALGFYDKASQLLLLPVLHVAAPVGSVAFPVLSRLQDEPIRFRAYFERCLLLTLACGMPLVAFLFVTADRVVPFALGARWAESVPIFRAFAPAAFVGPLYSSVAWAMAAMGRTRRQFKWTLLISSATVLAFLCGVPWGAVGVAAAFSLSRVTLLAPTLAYCYKDSPLGWAGLLVTASRPALASALAALTLFLVGGWLSAGVDTALSLAAECILYGLLYLAAWAAVPGGPRALREMIVPARDFWRARGAEGV